jgi:hypothetical protein
MNEVRTKAVITNQGRIKAAITVGTTIVKTSVVRRYIERADIAATNKVRTNIIRAKVVGKNVGRM